MQYKMVGEYPAPDFFSIERNTGMIYLVKDLREDSLQLNSYEVRPLVLSSSYISLHLSLSLQLSIIAYDASTVQIQGSTKVYITVTRNENRPSFSETSYRANINMSFALGAPIIQVQAQDEDSTVCIPKIPIHMSLSLSD